MGFTENQCIITSTEFCCSKQITRLRMRNRIHFCCERNCRATQQRVQLSWGGAIKFHLINLRGRQSRRLGLKHRRVPSLGYDVSCLSGVGSKYTFHKAFFKNPCGSAGKEFTCNVVDLGLIPGLARSLKKGKATHSSILAWRMPWTVQSVGQTQSVAKGRTRLSHFYFHISSKTKVKEIGPSAPGYQSSFRGKASMKTQQVCAPNPRRSRRRDRKGLAVKLEKEKKNLDDKWNKKDIINCSEGVFKLNC